MRRLLVCLAALAACSIPTKHPSTGDGGGPHDAPLGLDGRTPDGPAADARTGPFRCIGQPFPTAAPPNVTLSGTVKNASGAPIGGAQIAVDYPVNGPFSLPTGSDGSWSITLTTGGTAAMADIFVSYSGGVSQGDSLVPVHIYPSHPVDKDLAFQIVLQAAANFEMFPAGYTFDPNSPVELVVAVADCDGHAVQGATVSLTPSAGNIYYVPDSGSGPAPTATSSAGLAVIFGLPTNTAFTLNTSTPAGAFRTYMIGPEPTETQILASVQP